MTFVLYYLLLYYLLYEKRKHNINPLPNSGEGLIGT